MQVYVYSYKNSTSNEPIGRVKATGLLEARKKISKIKQLDVDVIDQLFNIRKFNDHEKSSKKY